MPTPNRSRTLCVLAVLGVLAVLSGCGGSDKKSSSASNAATTPAPAATTTTPGGSSSGGSIAAYRAGLKQAAISFQNSVRAAVTKVGTGKTTAEKLAGLDALKASINQAADSFAALNPPANLKSDNDELVTELHGFATSVDGVQQAARSNDPSKVAAAGTQLQQAQAKITQTIARIQAKL